MAKEFNVPVESPVIMERYNHNLNSKDGRLFHRFKDSPELEHLEKYFFHFHISNIQVTGNM